MLPYPPAGSGKPSGENHPERQCEADLEPETRTVDQEDAQMIENTVKQEATVKELTSMSDLTILIFPCSIRKIYILGGNINGAVREKYSPFSGYD